MRAACDRCGKAFTYRALLRSLSRDAEVHACPSCGRIHRNRVPVRAWLGALGGGAATAAWVLNETVIEGGYPGLLVAIVLTTIAAGLLAPLLVRFRPD